MSENKLACGLSSGASWPDMIMRALTTVALVLVASVSVVGAGTLGQDRLEVLQENDYNLGLRTLALSGSDDYVSYLTTIFDSYGHPVDIIKVSIFCL